MKKILFFMLFIFSMLLTACGEDSAVIGGADGPTSIYVSEEEKTVYEQITAKEAKEIMDGQGEFVILDVREQEEFDEGHIPGALLLPYGQIEAKAEELLPDKEKQILVYCRSGRRSKIAAETLAALGYTDVKEFGGIIDWPYEVEQ